MQHLGGMIAIGGIGARVVLCNAVQLIQIDPVEIEKRIVPYRPLFYAFSLLGVCWSTNNDEVSRRF
jgi:hypothetical protein